LVVEDVLDEENLNQTMSFCFSPGSTSISSPEIELESIFYDKIAKILKIKDENLETEDSSQTISSVSNNEQIQIAFFRGPIFQVKTTISEKSESRKSKKRLCSALAHEKLYFVPKYIIKIVCADSDLSQTPFVPI
jgi:hypothetical protein